MDISERQYFSEEETTFPQIVAGLQSGEFQVWNRGPNGEQWFKRIEAGAKTIRGIPRTTAEAAADCEMIGADDTDDSIEAEVASEIEWVGDDIEAEAADENLHLLSDEELNAQIEAMEVERLNRIAERTSDEFDDE